MGVAYRKTELLDDFEGLMDNYEDDIPPKIYSRLEAIYIRLNREIPRLEDELDEANSRIADLEECIAELENKK